jgi:hypothetical protein
MNEPTNDPPLYTEQVGKETTVPDNEQLVSLLEKPEPDTCTPVPTAPEIILTEIDGPLEFELPLIVRMAEAKSPAGLPVSLTL